MSDTKTTVNTGDSTSPEPSDAQDPCDEYINLTINKVWKDFRNMDNIRPDTIRLQFPEAGRMQKEQNIQKSAKL